MAQQVADPLRREVLALLDSRKRWCFARNADEVRLVAQTLNEVALYLRHLADTALELPLVEAAHAAGLAAAAATVAQMERQVADAVAECDREDASPLAVTLDPVDAVVNTGGGASRQPWSMHSVVAAPQVPVRGVSSSVLRIDTAGSSPTASFAEDSIVIGIFGAARLVWPDQDGRCHENSIRRHEHGFVRRGTQFRILNDGAQPFLGLLVRATGVPTSAIDGRLPSPR